MLNEKATVFTCLNAILAVMSLVSLHNFWHVCRNIRFFDRYKVTKNREKFSRFFIVVPLMHEVETVETLLETLTSFDYPKESFQIIIATTVRERDTKGVNATYQKATEVAKALNQSKQLAHIRVTESDQTHGYVATQINHALSTVGSEIKPDDFVVVYNADSLPGKHTLQAANEILHRYGKKVLVMQQSSLFTKNIPAMRSVRSYGAIANALHQSLWTLKHEVSMTRKQSLRIARQTGTEGFLKRLFATKFTVCVGHGLFVRKSYYTSNPLNEDAAIEDTHYGLYQSLNKVGVYTVPVLENSESPSTFARVTAQKRTWFKLVFDLSKLLHTKGRSLFAAKKSRAEFISILFQVSFVYIVWLLHSVFLIGTLVLALIGGQWTTILFWIVVYTLYWVLPAVYLAVHHRRLVGSNSLTVTDALLASTLGAPAILTHSLGPWLAIYDRLRGNTKRKKNLR